MITNLYGNPVSTSSQRAAAVEAGFVESVYRRVQDMIAGPAPRQGASMSPPAAQPSMSMGGASGAMSGAGDAALAAASDPRVRDAALFLAATAAKVGLNAAALIVPGGLAGKYLAAKAADAIGERLEAYLSQDQDNRQTMGPGLSRSPAPRMR